MGTISVVKESYLEHGRDASDRGHVGTIERILETPKLGVVA